MNKSFYQRCYKPIQIQMAKLEITQKCNSRCKTCSTWQIQDSTLSRGESIQSELKGAEYLQVLEELKLLGCKYVEIHGGEPTLYKDLPLIVNKCAELGIATMITTNGLSMTGEIAQNLIDFRISRINYSLDGPRECHNLLRGRDNAFDKMMAAMGMIREADQKKIVYKNINTMVSSKNIERIEEVVEIAFENKIDIITFVHPSIANEEVITAVNQIFGEPVASHRIVCQDEFLITDLALIEEKREAIKSEAKKFGVRVDKTNFFTFPAAEIAKGIKRHPKPCWDIYGNIVIDAGGNVVPCELLRFKLGNVKENSLTDILSSERFEEFSKIYCRNIDDISICACCVESVY